MSHIPDSGSHAPPPLSSFQLSEVTGKLPTAPSEKQGKANKAYAWLRYQSVSYYGTLNPKIGYLINNALQNERSGLGGGLIRNISLLGCCVGILALSVPVAPLMLYNNRQFKKSELTFEQHLLKGAGKKAQENIKSFESLLEPEKEKEIAINRLETGKERWADKGWRTKLSTLESSLLDTTLDKSEDDNLRFEIYGAENLTHKSRLEGFLLNNLKSDPNKRVWAGTIGHTKITLPRSEIISASLDSINEFDEKIKLYEKLTGTRVSAINSYQEIKAILTVLDIYTNIRKGIKPETIQADTLTTDDWDKAKQLFEQVIKGKATPMEALKALEAHSDILENQLINSKSDLSQAIDSQRTGISQFALKGAATASVKVTKLAISQKQLETIHNTDWKETTPSKDQAVIYSVKDLPGGYQAHLSPTHKTPFIEDRFGSAGFTVGNRNFEAYYVADGHAGGGVAHAIQTRYLERLQVIMKRSPTISPDAALQRVSEEFNKEMFDPTSEISKLIAEYNDKHPTGSHQGISGSTMGLSLIEHLDDGTQVHHEFDMDDSPKFVEISEEGLKQLNHLNSSSTLEESIRQNSLKRTDAEGRTWYLFSPSQHLEPKEIVDIMAMRGVGILKDAHSKTTRYEFNNNKSESPSGFEMDRGAEGSYKSPITQGLISSIRLPATVNHMRVSDGVTHLSTKSEFYQAYQRAGLRGIVELNVRKKDPDDISVIGKINTRTQPLLLAKHRQKKEPIKP